MLTRTLLVRFLLLAVVSVVLMTADHRGGFFKPVRTGFSVLNLPGHWLFSLPATTEDTYRKYYPDAELYTRYRKLLEKQTELEVRLQRYEALRAENARLAKLLGTRGKLEYSGLFAEVIEIGLRPLAHRVALSRGVESGVYLGQPVLTTAGVLGQVSAVGVGHSVVTLLTDPSHAIPVQIERNGLRTIAQGSGVPGVISLPFLTSNADLHSDDVLLTSGLGGTFPSGYKVAQVQEVINDANAAFLSVRALPFVNVAVTQEVLLLQAGAKGNETAVAAGIGVGAGVGVGEGVGGGGGADDGAESN